MLIEASMDAIADRLPRTRSAMDVMARQFNATFTHHWMRIIEFLKLHYVLTRRTDSDFWRDNVAAASIPDGLAERLELWRHHSPAPRDFEHAREVFSPPSYQYVLHGMGFDGFVRRSTRPHQKRFSRSVSPRGRRAPRTNCGTVRRVTATCCARSANMVCNGYDRHHSAFPSRAWRAAL